MRTEDEIRAGLAAELNKAAPCTADEIRLARETVRGTVESIHVLLHRVERSLPHRFKQQLQDLAAVGAAVTTMHALLDENLARAEAMAPATRSTT